MNKTELADKTLALTKAIIRIADDENIYEKYGPEYHEYVKYNVSKFSYDETGTHLEWSPEFFGKPFFTGLPVLKELILKCDAYNQLANQFKDNELAVDEISYFIQKVIIWHYENPSFDEHDIETLARDFVENISSESGEIKATVQLTGFIINSDAIHIPGGFTLRQPRKEDFEFERPIYPPLPQDRFHHPNAFLEITHQTKKPMDIEEDIQKAVTILQLFRTGSVRYTTYKMKSSFRSIFANATISTTENVHPVYSFRISQSDGKKLQQFWDSMSSSLPHNLYKFDVLKNDHISIAFDRYKDAILHGGIEERKLANAMMGLEALYFKPSGELQELDYRLRMRMAKVLGNLGYDPVQIKNTVKESYNIRSIFSHGGLLSYKQKNKYQEKYPGGVSDLTKVILDFLRESIILSITVKMEKEEWIDLIDNSLIDREADKKLSDILARGKMLIEKTKV